MVRVLRKVVGKTVVCPNCGNELAFDDSDEKLLFDSLTGIVDESRFIVCPCTCCVITRDKEGNISPNVTLITVDVNEETENAED